MQSSIFYSGNYRFHNINLFQRRKGTTFFRYLQIFSRENAEGEIINAVMADVTGCTSAIAVFNEREREVGQDVPLTL